MTNSIGAIGPNGTGNRPEWYDLAHAAMNSPVFDPNRAVYVNRTLRFDRVRAVGFDFDHTLAVYDAEQLDSLAQRLVVERLIEHEGIPREYFDDMPDPSFARVGLLVDTKLGHVIKIDRYGHVSHAYRGVERLSLQEKREIYGESDVIPNVTDGDRFVQMDSVFAKPEVLIFAAVAPRLDPVERAQIWRKVRHHTDTVHRDGSLKRIITASPRDYIKPDPRTAELIETLRRGGKKVFLLTNSEWEYTAAMMNPVLGRDGDAEDTRWTNLFELVVVEGRKPRFFSPRNSDAPEVLFEDHILRGGSISHIEERLGFNGPEILYVGDHIYSDLISSKRRRHWRTMLVIPELEDELRQQALLPGIVEQLQQAEDRRVISEREVHYWTMLEAALQKLEDPQHVDVTADLRETCQIRRAHSTRDLREFIQQRERLRSRLSQATNEYWGSLFRASSELTYYGRQVEDFACMYSSRATNLLFYANDHYYRSSMDYLPHELEQL